MRLPWRFLRMLSSVCPHQDTRCLHRRFLRHRSAAWSHNDIMGIGPSHLNGVDQTGILVHSNVRLVAEVPCVSLLHLMRVRVPLLSLIFCGGWRCNDRGVHNGPFFEDKSPLLQNPPLPGGTASPAAHCVSADSETPQCISVRHLVAGVHSAELRKGSAVYDLSHCCFVRQIIQVLQQIDPQHPLQIVGLIAAFPLVVARLMSVSHSPHGRCVLSAIEILFSLSVPAPIHHSGQTDLLAYPCLYFTTLAFIPHLFCAVLP